MWPKSTVFALIGHIKTFAQAHMVAPVVEEYHLQKHEYEWLSTEIQWEIFGKTSSNIWHSLQSGLN